ncbi:MAG: hypothetical protein NT027_07165, partial [Proteobacteria bacterium]|nr:hypothetical protein [Pseudomonadota bacterium]
MQYVPSNCFSYFPGTIPIRPGCPSIIATNPIQEESDEFQEKNRLKQGVVEIPVTIECPNVPLAEG